MISLLCLITDTKVKSWGTNSDSTLLHNTSLVLYHPPTQSELIREGCTNGVMRMPSDGTWDPMHWFSFSLWQHSTKFQPQINKRNILSQNTGPILTYFATFFWVKGNWLPRPWGKISRLSHSLQQQHVRNHTAMELTSLPVDVLVEVVPQQQLTFEIMQLPWAWVVLKMWYNNNNHTTTTTPVWEFHKKTIIVSCK